MRSNMEIDSSSLPGIMRDVLAGYVLQKRQSGTEVCIELVQLWDHVLIRENEDDALKILSEAFAYHFSKPAEWTQGKSTFTTRLCDSLHIKSEMSDSLSVLLNTAVGALLPEVRLSSPAPGLSNAFTLVRPVPTSLAFWSRFATRCAKRTKILSLFTDVPSLVKNLSSFSPPCASSQDGHMLHSILELLLMLEDRGRAHDEAMAAIESFLQPLRRQLEQLFGDETFANASCADLKALNSMLSPLTIIESMLFKEHLYGKPRLPLLLETHVTRWAKSFQIIEAEAPFLDALQRDVSGIPALVTTLEGESKFRASKSDAMLESSRTMEARATRVHEWLHEVSVVCSTELLQPVTPPSAL